MRASPMMLKLEIDRLVKLHRLEPGTDGEGDGPLTSIAISLKRIADSLSPASRTSDTLRHDVMWELTKIGKRDPSKRFTFSELMDIMDAYFEDEMQT